jgi:hypothetical protein
MVSGIMAWPAHGFTLGETRYVSTSVAGGSDPTAFVAAGAFVQPHFTPIGPDHVVVHDMIAQQS